MTIKSIRRWILFRPLAAVIAILVLPVLACLDGNSANAGMFKAAAQVVISGCAGDGTNQIIQSFCVGGVAYTNDLQQLEVDAVNSYIGEHGLTTADAALIYSVGRSDLRTEIRAQMLAIMIGIIKKSPSVRTAHEQTLFNWLTALVQQNEIALYSNAVNQFQLWQSDPCTFQLDPVIASAYNLSYDGAPYCGSPLNSLLAGPPVPAESYFTAYGMRKSYAAPGDTFSNFSTLVSGTATDIGEIVGIATAVGVILSGISTAVVANSVIQATDGIAELGIEGAAEIPEIVVGVETAEELGSAFLSSGPAAIILVAIAIGVAAGEEAFSNEAIINDLKNMEGNLTQVTQTPPSLVAFNSDTTGQGSYKIQMSMVAQTVPELASSAPLPTHQQTDASFAIQPNGSNTTTITPTLSYKDWTGNVWSAQTSGGWFVQTCSGGTCTQPDSINGTLHYLDWSGAKWSAARIGNSFVHQKAVPASTDKTCAPDLITKVTAPPFTNCSSYTTPSVPMTAGDGGLITMSLSPLIAPVFTTPATLSFLPGIPGSQTIVAAGNPTPSICVESTTLPSAFSLNGGSCGSGSFQLTYDGTTGPGSYSITLSAAGAGAGTGTATFTVAVTQDLSISSSNIAVGTLAYPFHFLVTTTGYPKPALSLDPLFPLGGLTFQDNGDGTATFSGTDNSASLLICSHGVVVGSPSTPCGIIATNAQGTVEQAFSIQFNEAPIAHVISPLSTTFHTGIQNQVVISSAGATTPVSWSFGQNNVPWATLQDNGNASATLIGTPPIGTSGAFTVLLTPVAQGTSGMGLDNNTASYTINVVDSPVFSSPNTATFTVGTPGSFNVLTTQGTVSALNTLPNGLTFNSGNPPNITGTPAAGTGGQYIVKLADDGGTAGTATQDLNLQVNEGANITSPNDAIFFVGTYNAFPVTTTGFPYLSNHAVGSNFIPPTDPSQGQGMFFTATGLPSSMFVSNINNVGFATGTLTIQGIPGPSDVGTHLVQITAQNGVGAIAHQTLTLQVLAHNPAAQVNLLSNWVLTRDSSNNVIATVVLANNGSVAAQNVTLTTAKIGTASGTVLPAAVPVIPAESTATFSIVFPAASVGTHGSAGVLTLSGSFTGGTFSNAGRIVLP